MLTASSQRTTLSIADTVAAARHARHAWAMRPIRDRLLILRRFRHLAAARSADLVRAVASPHRTPAQVLTSEVIPLLAACKFIEQNARRILAPRKLGRRGKPLWLGRVHAEIHRDPLGLLLIIAPANYPLFLPGVQLLQALAAGNSVLLKAGRDGSPIARLLADLLHEAGLPHNLLTLLDESPDAGLSAIAAGVDKVFLTGGAKAGEAIRDACAKHNTPATLELSGCDAALLLPGANIPRAVKALTYAATLNAGQSCIAPRRLLVARPLVESLEQSLLHALQNIPPTAIPPAAFIAALEPITASIRAGAKPLLPLPTDPARFTPILLTDVTPDMPVAATELFLPILSIMPTDTHNLAAATNACPYALAASIYGPEKSARALAQKLTVGTVTINDTLVPTADPRIPFTARRASGHGSTRGPEGLLEMTAPKTLLTRRGNFLPHLTPEHPLDESLFTTYLHTAHAPNLSSRLRASFNLFNLLRKRR